METKLSEFNEAKFETSFLNKQVGVFERPITSAKELTATLDRVTETEIVSKVFREEVTNTSLPLEQLKAETPSHTYTEIASNGPPATSTPWALVERRKAATMKNYINLNQDIPGDITKKANREKRNRRATRQKLNNAIKDAKKRNDAVLVKTTGENKKVTVASIKLPIKAVKDTIRIKQA